MNHRLVQKSGTFFAHAHGVVFRSGQSVPLDILELESERAHGSEIQKDREGKRMTVRACKDEYITPRCQL